MIGVVIPVHNEEALLGACLLSVLQAARHPSLAGEPVTVVATLDACTDGSRRIAEEAGVEVVNVHERNVGKARAAGADVAIRAGARWLAFTDGDSQVPQNWLVAQLALHADAVCGLVSVDDWSVHPVRAYEVWQERYCDRDGHRHVHGANLGVSAEAYQAVGGFPALACSEDLALVESLVAKGMRISWSATPRVKTSGRIDARARGGFGDTLIAWGAFA